MRISRWLIWKRLPLRFTLAVSSSSQFTSPDNVPFPSPSKNAPLKVALRLTNSIVCSQSPIFTGISSISTLPLVSFTLPVSDGELAVPLIASWPFSAPSSSRIAFDMGLNGAMRILSIFTVPSSGMFSSTGLTFMSAFTAPSCSLRMFSVEVSKSSSYRPLAETSSRFSFSCCSGPIVQTDGVTARSKFAVIGAFLPNSPVVFTDSFASELAVNVSGSSS